MTHYSYCISTQDAEGTQMFSELMSQILFLVWVYQELFNFDFPYSEKSIKS